MERGKRRICRPECKHGERVRACAGGRCVVCVLRPWPSVRRVVVSHCSPGGAGRGFMAPFLWRWDERADDATHAWARAWARESGHCCNSERRARARGGSIADRIRKSDDEQRIKPAAHKFCWGGHFHGCLLCGLNRWSNKTETGNSAHAMNLTICKFAKGSMGSVSDSLLFHLKTPRNFKVHQRGIGKM